MFKKIPGTTDYRIDLSGKIVDILGNEVLLMRRSQDMVEIDLFGKLRTVKLKWLIALSWYECGYIHNLEEHLDKIRFYPANILLKVRCGVIMQFTEPVYYKPGFRVIPCFPQYAVNFEGLVIDTSKNVHIDESRETTAGYISKYIRSPDRCMNRDNPLHRLVALAWLPNKDFINRPIVNHINGNKKDPSLKNLEWCSYQENVQHALDTGLTPCCIAMKTRDVITGEVEIFQSAAELARKLGLSRGWSPMSFLERLPGFLHKKRYEVKRFDDESPWYYEINTYDPEEAMKQIYTFRILDKRSGETEIFTNSRAFLKRYKLYGVKNIFEGVKLLQERNKDYEVTYKRNATLGPYRLVNRADGKIIVVSSMRKAAEIIGSDYNEVSIDLRKGRKYIYSGKWIVLARDQEANLDEYMERPKSFFKVEIVTSDTGEIVIADSIKHAARLTRITPRAVTKLVRNGERFKGYTFRPLGQ